MSDKTDEGTSLAEGAGCGLLGIGVIGLIFGIAALLGVSDRIELEFFGIELNDRTGQWQWVVGCTLSVVIGVFLLRMTHKST